VAVLSGVIGGQEQIIEGRSLSMTTDTLSEQAVAAKTGHNSTWRVVIVTLSDSGLPIHESVLNEYSGPLARTNAIAFASGYNLGNDLQPPHDNKIAIVEGLTE
jgi:hypothetical protein